MEEVKKLNLVMEDVPKATRVTKDGELYKELVDFFNSMPVNKSFVVSNDTLASTTVEVKLREMITVEPGLRMKISRIKADGKITGVRVSKVAAPQPKTPTESQGEAKEVEGNG